MCSNILNYLMQKNYDRVQGPRKNSQNVTRSRNLGINSKCDNKVAEKRLLCLYFLSYCGRHRRQSVARLCPREVKLQRCKLV